MTRLADRRAPGGVAQRSSGATQIRTAGCNDGRPGTDPLDLWLRRGLRAATVDQGQNALHEPLPEAWLSLLDRLPGE